MNHKISTFIAIVVIAVGCNKVNNLQPAPATIAANPENSNLNPGHASMARLGGSYSQPISIDTANRMIHSYLNSVNYPYQDTALRTLSFDADSLRAYLSDSRIVTLKLVLAHQNTYINTDNNFGKYTGMKPGALTLIVAGVDNNDNLIKNKSNGVYEHALPCPVQCPTSSDAYLH